MLRGRRNVSARGGVLVFLKSRHGGEQGLELEDDEEISAVFQFSEQVVTKGSR